MAIQDGQESEADRNRGSEPSQELSKKVREDAFPLQIRQRTVRVSPLMGLGAARDFGDGITSSWDVYALLDRWGSKSSH